MTSDGETLGDLRLSTKDLDIPGFLYDRIAIDATNRVQLVSVVAEANKLRAMRALLGMAKNGGLRIEAAKGKVKRKSDNDYYLRSPGWCVPSASGYITTMNRLDYGLLHVVFRSKEPGFLAVSDPESLWRELRDTRFTTPIMRAWMPHIEKRLRERNLLEELRCFNCDCSILKCNTAQLDAIVRTGIESGGIAIPPAPAVA